MDISSIPSDVRWFFVETCIKIIEKLPYYIKNKVSAPVWVIDKYNGKYKIAKSGEEATFIKNQDIKPTHKCLTEYVHRGILAAGKVSEFKFGQHSELKAVGSEYIKKSTEYIIRERFVRHHNFDKDEILKVGKLIKSCLSYNLIDSFPESHESIKHKVCYPTSEIEITIELPKDKPARNLKLTKQVGASFKELPKPTISDDGCMITWKAKKLWRIDATYIIEWDW